MPTLNMKDFLTEGALLQTGPDRYVLMWGPFKRLTDVTISALNASKCLLNPEFWFFLNESENIAQNFVYQPAQVVELNREEFIGMLSLWAAKRPEVEWLNITETCFKSQFDWSLAQFRKGALTKTVPIILQNGRAEIAEAQVVYLLQQLLGLNDYGWSYGFWSNGQGFIGHTPEILLHWHLPSERSETVALAGTYARAEGAEELILKDEKIRREHQIVIDDIQKKLAHRRFDIAATEALELKHLVHLKTDFSYKLPSALEAVKDVQSLHPTAAMGLYPQNPELYREFSGFSTQQQRGSFAAPFGFVGEKDVQIVVGIRQMQFGDGQVRIFSGCGVTSDSHYDVELKELENKRNSVKKMLGLHHD